MVATTLDQQAQLTENWQKYLQQGGTNKRQFRSQQDNLSNIPLQETVGFRGAGWHDATTQQGITGDSELFNALKGKFGYYKQNGQDNYGYYGNDNVYDQGVQERLLGEGGYTKDTSGLNDLYKQQGFRLPELNGTTYANAAQRAYEQPLRDYQKQQQDFARQQQDYQQQLDAYNAKKASFNNVDSNYYDKGFIPGSNNTLSDGSFYRWQAGAPQYTSFLSGNSIIDHTKDQDYLDQLSEYNMGLRTEAPVARSLTQDEQIANDFTNYFKDTYPEGSGRWFYNKGGKEYDNTALEYSPTFGYKEQTYDSAPKGFAKFMPTLTMAALGAMTGGAAASMMAPAAAVGGTAGGLGLGGSMVAGAASAIPSAMRTGLNTGDWGKALGGVGMGAVSGGLGNAISPTIQSGLSSIFGDAVSPATTQALARAGSGALTSATTKGLSNLLQNNRFGQGMGEAAVGGSLAGLGTLLAGSNASVGERQQMGSLVSNAGKLANTLYKTSKTKRG